MAASLDHFSAPGEDAVAKPYMLCLTAPYTGVLLQCDNYNSKTPPKQSGGAYYTVRWTGCHLLRKH